MSNTFIHNFLKKTFAASFVTDEQCVDQLRSSRRHDRSRLNLDARQSVDHRRRPTAALVRLVGLAVGVL